MATQTKPCDACGVSVTFTGHRGFGPAHTNCAKRGAVASDASHPVCPVHKSLVWVVGPYSTFRSCADRQCTAGKRGKPYRFCAPRGAGDSPSEANAIRGERAEQIIIDEPADLDERADNQMESIEEEDNEVKSNSTPQPADGAPDVQAALQALMAAIQPKAPTVDMATVQAMVNNAVDQKLQHEARVTLVIEHKPSEVKIEVNSPHPYLARVIELAKAGIPVYLWGPAGGGKTTAAMQVAKALQRGFEIDTLDPSTFRSMVQGYMTPTGEPVHTSFTRCWTEGKIYCADENDNAPGHVQTLYNSALANGHAPLAWGNIDRAEGFAFIGTGNTPGWPTRAFPDRKPMSAAFADRLYFVEWPLDEQGERVWSGVGGKAKRQIPTVTKREIKAGQWVDFVQNLRDWSTTNAPTLMITPRASLVGLKALACGETPEQVADGLIFRGADSELKSKALNAVRLP